MSHLGNIYFSNANSRETYFTIHNVKAAHKFSKGKGIKVGIIDWLFAFDKYGNLYTFGKDFTGVPDALYKVEGHGLCMATVLKEIAPECEIYALNAVLYEEGKSSQEQDALRSKYLINAIEWSIENKLDILTYSHGKISDPYKADVDLAIMKANSFGIITTFIHNDNPANLWPSCCLPFYNDQNFSREPDLNIFHFDYNVLHIPQYERYIKMLETGERIESGNDLPYFSCSSMSPVLGGFVAILKSLNPKLTPSQVKDILVKTSYPITEKGEFWFEVNPCPNVVDIGKAVEYVRNNKRNQ